MSKLERVTPIVPVENMDESVDFFAQVLGFNVGIHQENHAYIYRDEVAFRLVPVGPTKDLHDENSQQHCYIDVADIDALYTELKPALDKLPSGRVRALFDTDYGQREFHVIDTGALLISFGQKIAT